MPSPAQRANRRNLAVFLGTFLLACVASLAYTFTRPAEYRAAARIQINPGAVQVESINPSGGSQGADAPRSVSTELQVVTSRPVLEAAARSLSPASNTALSLLGPDPMATMQAALEARLAGGTDVVEVVAVGTDAGFVAELVNAVIAAYRERLEESHRESSGESLAQIADETAKLEAEVLAKRSAVEAFRVRHGVVSLEREENRVLAQTKGLAASVTVANEKLADAEGRYRSLQEAVAEGRSVVRARDNPTLANLEQRVSQIREGLRELERTYTPDYLALDNRVRAQRARLTELEQQIAVLRRKSEEDALDEAQEAVAAARATVDRIQRQIANEQGAVQAFTARFNEYKELREELGQLESLHRDALKRKARLEAGERARRPSVRVLEAATVPREPWRPPYTRDALIGAGGSLLLGLLAMWLVELFNRTDPQPAVVFAQPIAYPVRVASALPMGASDALTHEAAPALRATPVELLPPASSFPRELAADEVAALLSASSGRTRLAVVLILCGLAPDEIASLKVGDVDQSAHTVRVGGASARTIELPPPAWMVLGTLGKDADFPLLAAESGSFPTVEELASEIFYAAHDAALARPGEVTPDALRHTYVAFLVRQGIRFVDLVKITGHLPPERAAAYGTLVAGNARRPLGEVDRVITGMRQVRLRDNA